MISDRDLADDLARAALAVCPMCASGSPRVDIHSGAATDYHGYEYNPCKMPAALREALDVWRKARAPHDPELLGVWEGVPLTVQRPVGMSDREWAEWKDRLFKQLGPR